MVDSNGPNAIIRSDCYVVLWYKTQLYTIYINHLKMNQFREHKNKGEKQILKAILK